MDTLMQYYGFFQQGEFLAPALGATGLVFLTLGYFGLPLWSWAVFLNGVFFGFGLPGFAFAALNSAFGVFLIKPIRTYALSMVVMKVMKMLKLIPHISPTEKAALDAGVVWVDKDLFSGKPDLKKLIAQPYPKLTPEEQAFIDGPVEKLCQMIDDWEIYKTKNIPDDVLKYLGKERFFGMIIPKKYGGLEFSAMAHSEVIMKLASRSLPVTITAMVPNSLGPAELLNHFGTEEQKQYYLPRLACGQEIPCFALTEPRAGSDASSIQAEGVLFKGTDGKIYIRLNWNKRWITLAAISTVLGLAFRLRDPDNLLGKGEEIGITCALVPSNTPGVVLGRRHDPMGVPFYNCPTQGHDVVVEAEKAIIGGLASAGLGWNMLMECLGAGRGISLPAQSVGAAKTIVRVVSAHATIRKQFGIAIGKFEGVEEPLARMGGFTYLLEAMRRYTLGALDQGIKPSVITAIAKYQATELSRVVINDGMDIMGGTGISRGPRNLIANYYIGSPIGITVEGANILTRTLMIFGQGALRAHPYAYKEVKAIEDNNLKAFDEAFWGHIGHIFTNAVRAVVLSCTRARLVRAPIGGSVGRYYQKLVWASATFAIMADVAMGVLGGKLKIKEKITGRFADILSWMYMSVAVLRRFEAEGRRKEDLAYIHFCLRYANYQIQNAFDGIFSNLLMPHPLRWVFNWFLRVWSRTNSLNSDISDRLTQGVASALLEDSDFRNRLTDGIYLSKDPEDQIGRIERAFKVIKNSEETEKKINRAIRDKKLPKKRVYLVIDEALQKGIINQEEYNDLKESADARWDVIQVDDFSQDEYLNNEKTKRTVVKMSAHTQDLKRSAK